MVVDLDAIEIWDAREFEKSWNLQEDPLRHIMTLSNPSGCLYTR